MRQITACIGLILLQASCSQNIKVGIPGSIPTGFDKELYYFKLNNCYWDKVSIHKGLFKGEFHPQDEHRANSFFIEGKVYTIILSNDLADEYRSSSDGTGGKKFSSAFKRRSRKDIDGYIVNSTLYCPKFEDLMDEHQFIFIRNFGTDSSIGF